MAKRRILQRIGHGIESAMEAWWEQQRWNTERQESEALERWRNAQAGKLESEQKYRDQLARELGLTSSTSLPMASGKDPIESPERLVAPSFSPPPQYLHRRLVGPLPQRSQVPIGRPPVAASLIDMSAFEGPSMRSGPPAEGRRVVGGEGRAGGLNDPERPPRPDVDGWEWVDDAVQGPPSPLLRSIEQTGAFRPQAPSKYGFIQSGTTQARQASGDGTDLVDGRPATRFRSGVTRTVYDPPTQYDPVVDRRRHLDLLGGGTGGSFPRQETAEWQFFEPFMKNFVSGVADILNARPTTLKYTNAAGQSETLTLNLDRVLNRASIVAAREMPGVGDILEQIGAGFEPHPMDGLDATGANFRQMEMNTPVDGIIHDSVSKPLDDHNPLKRAMLDNPLGPKFSTGGIFGPSIRTTEISEQSRRVLENMVPIANVAQQVGDLALSLNTQETRFLAALGEIGQNIDSWSLTTPWWTPEDVRKELGLPEKPLSQAQANKLWDDVNPNSNSTERARGLDRIRQLSKLRHAYAGIFAEMGGERGRKTEQDVLRALQMVPGAGETIGLTRAMLDTLYTNMINTYDSIVRGFAVTLGQLYTDLQGQTAIEGGLMGKIFQSRQDIWKSLQSIPPALPDARTPDENQHVGGVGVRGPQLPGVSFQENSDRQQNNFGRGVPRPQDR
jgi:hypothetical protein